MYLLSHLSSPLYRTSSSKQCYICSIYVFPVVVFLAVVMDDLQSVFSSPWYPLPLSLKINPLLSTTTPPHIFLDFFLLLLRKFAFHFKSLQMLSAPLMPWRFDALGKGSGLKQIDKKQKNIHYVSRVRFSVFYISRKDPDEFKESWKLLHEGGKNHLCVR